MYELTEKNSVDSWISAIKNVAQTPLEFPEIKFNSSSLSRTPSYRLSVMNIIKESTQKVVMHGVSNYTILLLFNFNNFMKYRERILFEKVFFIKVEE